MSEITAFSGCNEGLESDVIGSGREGLKLSVTEGREGQSKGRHQEVSEKKVSGLQEKRAWQTTR